MKKLLLFGLVTVFICSCGGSGTSDPAKENKKLTAIKQKSSTNLNISILLDLSDRIDTIKYSNPSMEYYRRDVGYLISVAKTFSDITSNKLTRKLNDKIQLYFDPEPMSSEINDLSNKLKFNITKDKGNGTLEYLDNISNEYATYGLSIYKQALKDDNYVGSDTWGFFKNKVKDYCVEEGYRNILVILTDGYVYYKNNLLTQDNFSTYITPQTIRSKRLNQSNWKEIIKTKKHGFIPLDLDLSNLEILVLGINSVKNGNNKYDYDVLEKYWSDWIYGMGVKKENFAFKTAALPSNMNNIIKSFISKKN